MSRFGLSSRNWPRSADLDTMKSSGPGLVDAATIRAVDGTRAPKLFVDAESGAARVTAVMRVRTWKTNRIVRGGDEAAIKKNNAGAAQRMQRNILSLRSPAISAGLSGSRSLITERAGRTRADRENDHERRFRARAVSVSSVAPPGRPQWTWSTPADTAVIAGCRWRIVGPAQADPRTCRTAREPTRHV